MVEIAKPDSVPGTESEVRVIGTATAPVIACNGVAAYGFEAGFAEIELATRVLTPLRGGGTRSDLLIVGHLRLSSAGLTALKDTIQKIEAMLAPTDEKPN